MAAGVQLNGTIRQAERIALHMVIEATRLDRGLPRATSVSQVHDTWHTDLTDESCIGTGSRLYGSIFLPGMRSGQRMRVVCILDPEWTSGVVTITPMGEQMDEQERRFSCRLNQKGHVAYMEQVPD